MTNAYTPFRASVQGFESENLVFDAFELGNLLHKLLGFLELRIKTSSGPEFELRGVFVSTFPREFLYSLLADNIANCLTPIEGEGRMTVDLRLGRGKPRTYRYTRPRVILNVPLWMEGQLA